MALAIEFPGTVKNVMLAGDVEDLVGLEALEKLAGRVELFRLWRAA